MNLDAALLGGGSWGTTVASLIARNAPVTLWARDQHTVDEINSEHGPVFCDVILAAPDIDRDLFRDVIVLELLESNLCEHYTLYASSSDEVIKTSQKLQVYPRVGNADDGLVAVYHEAFDTIDASAVESGWLALNHDYFITEPRVLRDLIEVLRKGNRDPASPGRGLARP